MVGTPDPMVEDEAAAWSSDWGNALGRLRTKESQLCIDRSQRLAVRRGGQPVNTQGPMQGSLAQWRPNRA